MLLGIRGPVRDLAHLGSLGGPMLWTMERAAAAWAHNNLGLALFQGGGSRGGGGPIHRGSGTAARAPSTSRPTTTWDWCSPATGARTGGGSLHRGASRGEPNYIKSYNNLGLVRLEEGSSQRRRLFTPRQQRAKPDNTMARCFLGLVRLQAGPARRGHHRAVRGAAAHEPDNDVARSNLGAQLLGAQGRLDEAITELSEVLRHEPDNDVARSNLGAALYKQRRFEEAERSFRRVLARQPENTGALKTLAWLLALRDRESAAEATGRLINRLPIGGRGGSLPSLVDTRAVVLIRAGQFDQALSEHWVRVRTADPRNPNLAIHMAWAYQARGRLDEARSAFQQARELGWRLDKSDPLERSHLDQLGRELTSGAAAGK